MTSSERPRQVSAEDLLAWLEVSGAPDQWLVTEVQGRMHVPMSLGELTSRFQGSSVIVQHVDWETGRLLTPSGSEGGPGLPITREVRTSESDTHRAPQVSVGGRAASSRREIVSAPDRVRPVAAIVVGGIIGFAQLLFGVLNYAGQMFSGPSPDLGELYDLFPAMEALTLFGGSITFLAALALLAGVMLTAALHDDGPRVVRIVVWVQLVWIAIATALTLAVYTSSDYWALLNPAIRGGLIGGSIGAGIGSLLFNGLVLYLFRKSRTW